MTSLMSRLPSRLPRVRSPRALAVAAAALVALAGLALVLLATARATVWAPETVTTARVTGQPGAPVIVTTPASTALDGPSLRIDVRGPGDKQVFVGVGRADDVAAYLGAAARVEVTGARDGRAVETRQGAEGSLPEPTVVDVWTASATGRGTTSLTWAQVPGRWRVLAAVDGATAPTEVVLTWQRARASSTAPALFAVGGLLLVLGIVVGALFFPKYFFFLFGVGYLAFGLVRAVILGLLDLPPGGEGPPRRRATDYIDPMEAYGSPPIGAEGRPAGRRRFGRRARRGEPGAPPAA